MANNPYAQPAPHDGADFGVPMEPARTSVLAVLSLICSLLCCIPSLGLLAVLLGVVALILISGSRGRVGGTGLAVAGTVIGLLVTAVWLLLLFGASGVWGRFSTIPSVLQAAQDRDLAAVQAELTPSQAALVTPEMLEEFAAAVEDSHGKYAGTEPSFTKAIELYTSFGDQLEGPYQQESHRYQNIGRNVIPIPVYFDSGPVLFGNVWPEKMQNPTMSANGMPLLENFGVVGSDDNWIWLIPPPTLAPAPATPAAPGAPAPDAGDQPAAETPSQTPEETPAETPAESPDPAPATEPQPVQDPAASPG